MKKLFFSAIAFFLAVSLHAQEGTDSRVITTAVPFLMITSDARAGGMGEQGVATSADTYSQQWNPSKYAFASHQIGIGASYTPYLSDLVNDIALLNFTGYDRISERSAVAASFKYFSLGDIDIVSENGENQFTERPNELAFDVSYALKLSERFSMAVTGRYLRSDLKLPSGSSAGSSDTKAASSFGVDVSGFYQSQEIYYSGFNGVWRAGFNISNVGPKISYDTDGQEYFIPTNLKLGAGFDFIFDADNKLSVSTEFNKLLVPTPPVRNENGEIIEGKDDNVSFATGIFQSFGDAPGGFSEELKEVTWAFGGEYWYQNAFALRTGYFNESNEKGGRKFANIGAGFKFKAVAIDMSYLFSTSKIRNPLENTLRVSLTFNLGDEYYDY
ncbi:type IX secretion system outer membrane channel protein PorV [Zhouia sp. PK063]|uniref:type IX secretion system outer membrane channel protein PorV n=1 Tax=Zhouia sp. PK063 TaxID=3373602 RepID=UPI00378CA5BC